MAIGRVPIPLSGKQFSIADGRFAAEVAEVGAGLRSFTAAGADVTCTFGDDELPPKCCGITLVPWPNRIRDGRYTFDGVEQQLALTEPDKHNAIHGLGRWARWDVLEHDEGSVRLGLDVVPQKGYPFQVHAEVRYSFDGDRGLLVELSARNDGPQRAPFGMGSHPYLSTGGTPLDEVLLRLPVDETFDVDENQIPMRTRRVNDDENFDGSSPLGSRRFDAGFTGLRFDDDRRFVAELHTGRMNTTLWFDETFCYLQMFTVDNLTPGQHGIAIEPMTCAPNAFNSGDGLLVLEPGEAWSGSWGITPR